MEKDILGCLHRRFNIQKNSFLSRKKIRNNENFTGPGKKFVKIRRVKVTKSRDDDGCVEKNEITPLAILLLGWNLIRAA